MSWGGIPGRKYGSFKIFQPYFHSDNRSPRFGEIVKHYVEFFKESRMTLELQSSTPTTSTDAGGNVFLEPKL